jgi:hypothetical protein
MPATTCHGRGSAVIRMVTRNRNGDELQRFTDKVLLFRRPLAAGPLDG